MKVNSAESIKPTSGSPRVSVIVPAWNVANYLGETVDSLLAQTYIDFEIIIVDDCSEDNTYEVALGYSDSRIRVIRHEVNQGVAQARNTAIRNAKGEYIALCDADDLAHPRRLEFQVAAMDTTPQLVMIGSHVSLMTDAGVNLRKIWKRPIREGEAAICLIFRNAIFTSTIMFKNCLFPKEGYRNYRVSEDYDFNCRISLSGPVGNLDLTLARYRVRKSGLTGCFSNLMPDYNGRVAKEYLQHLELDPTDRELEVNTFIGALHLEPSRGLLEEVETWLIKLATANDRLIKHDQQLFWNICGKEWFEVCKFSTPLGFYALNKFSASPLSKHYRPGIKEYLKLIVKSVIRHRRPSGL